MANATWLADVLRAAGLTVTEEPGWKTRGRPGAFDPEGVLLHHTASAKGGNLPALGIVRDGRPKDNPPLKGPLSQLMVARDGTWHVVAAGRCNHAGKGKWRGITDGNRRFIGVEAENNGVGEVWPDKLVGSYTSGVAALLAHLKADDSMAAGHKEYALPKGRKIDPTLDMLAFRDRLDNLINVGVAQPLSVAPVPTVDRTRAMLRKGSEGPSVRLLQTLLVKAGHPVTLDSDFGPATKTAVEAFQRKHGLKNVDGIVGPATWAALGIK